MGGEVAEILGERDAGGDRAAPPGAPRRPGPPCAQLRTPPTSARARAPSCSSSRRSERAVRQRRPPRAPRPPRGAPPSIGSSPKQRTSSAAPVSAAAPTAARTASRYSFGPNPDSLPSPTSRTRSAAMPGKPEQQPRRPGLAVHVALLEPSRSAPRAARSRRSAADESLRDSNTPTARHGVAVLSGARAFVLNSNRLSVETFDSSLDGASARRGESDYPRSNRPPRAPSPRGPVARESTASR